MKRFGNSMLFVAVALVISVILLTAVSASAADVDIDAVSPASDFGYYENNGEITISSYNGSDTVVEIPSEIDEKPVTTIGNSAFYWRTGITSITLPDSVTEICNGAFLYCENLESINIPKNVATIGTYVFDGCHNLTTISVSNENDEFGFSNGILYSQTSIIHVIKSQASGTVTVPSGITSIPSNAFSDCTNITAVVLPDSVTEIGGSAFSYCRNLTSINIPKNVATIGENVFFDCNNITTISVSNENDIFFLSDGILYSPTSIIHVIKSQVSGTVTVPSGITSIPSDAFSDCTNITAVVLPDSVTEIGGFAFSWCSNLTSINIPKNVATIGEQAFYGCDNLSTVTFSPENELLSFSNGLFYSQTTVFGSIRPLVHETVTIPSGITTISLYSFYNNENITTIILPNSVTEIQSNAFSYCTNLKSIIMPEGLTTIEGFAFNNCRNLSEIVIPSSVSEIGSYAFSNCRNLNTVVFLSNDENISFSSNVFRNCSNLTIYGYSGSAVQTYANDNSINFVPVSAGMLVDNSLFTYVVDGDDVTVTGRIASDWFVSVPEQIAGKNVTAISSGAFVGGDYAIISIPSTVTSIGEGAIGSDVAIAGHLGTAAKTYADANGNDFIDLDDSYTGDDFTYTVSGGTVTITGYTGDSLDVTIPAVIDGKPVTVIGSYAFSGKYHLTSIAIPETILRIEERGFGNCESITSVVLPKNLRYIGSRAFQTCWRVESLNIPAKVTTIEEYAFGFMDNLSEIIIDDDNELFDFHDGILYRVENGDLTCVLACALKALPQYEITIPDTVTTIGMYAFGSAKTERIVLPDSVTTINQGAFAYSEIRAVRLPSGVTINNWETFRNSTKIERLYIPDGTTINGSETFDRMTGLKTIYFGDNVTFYDWADLCIPSGVIIYGYEESQIATYAQDHGLTFVPYDTTLVGSEDFSHETNEDGTINIISYDGSETDIVIPNLIDGVPVVSLRNTYVIGYDIESIFIPETMGIDNTFDRTFYFSGGRNLETINVAANNPYFVVYNGALYSADMKELVLVPRKISPVNGTFEIPSGVTTLWGVSFAYCTNLTNIIIPNSVTSIGRNAFAESECEEIVLPNNLDRISSYSFWNSKIRRVVIPNSVMQIESFAFNGCTQLESVTIGSGVQRIYAGAFKNTTALKKIAIPSTVAWLYYNEAVSNTNDVFYGSGLETIVGDYGSTAQRYAQNKGFDFESFEDEELFSHITYSENLDGTITITEYTGSMSTITIPQKIDKKIVSAIGDHAFENSDAVKVVYFYYDLESIGTNAFRSDVILVSRSNDVVAEFAEDNGNTYADLDQSSSAALFSFSLYNGNYARVRYKGRRDKVVIIPETISGAYITQLRNECFDESGFTGAEDVHTEVLYIPRRVTYIHDTALIGLTNLKLIIVDPDNPIFTVINGALYEKDAETGNLKSIRLVPRNYEGEFVIESGVKYIAPYAFEGCTQITNVVVPSGVEAINESAFAYCTFTSIALPNSVKTMERRAFRECVNLESFTIPSNITSITERVFENCTSLSSVVFPDNCRNLYNNSFIGTTSLTTVTLPRYAYISNDAFIDGGLTTIYCYVQSNAKSYAEAHDGVTYIDRESAMMTNDRFIYKFMPESDNTVYISGYYGNGGNITVPATISGYPVIKIGANAFNGNYDIYSVTISEGITEIENGAFNWAGNLSSVSIPSTVTTIGYYVFGHTNITNFTVAAGNPKYSVGENSVLLSDNGTVLVYYPAGLYGTAEIPASVRTLRKESFLGTNVWEIVIPSGVETIENFTFENCNVERLVISDTVSSIGNGIVYNCYSLTSLTVDENNSTFYSNGNVIITKDDHALTTVAPCVSGVYHVPNNVTKIKSYAFSTNRNITSVIMYNVTRVEGNAFYDCPNLTTVVIPATVTSFGGRISNSNAYTTVIGFAGSTAESNANYFGYAFVAISTNNGVTVNNVRMNGRGGVSIPNSLYGYGVTVSDDAFANVGTATVYGYYGSSAQEKASARGLNFKLEGSQKFTYNINQGNEAPYVTVTGYTGSDSVVIVPEQFGGVHVAVIGYRAFYNNKTIQEVYLRAIEYLDKEAFYNCTRMTIIEFSRNLYYIGESALAQTSINYVYLPETYGNITIGSKAFAYCSRVQHFHISSKLTSIGWDAFRGMNVGFFTINENNNYFKLVDGHLFSKDGTIMYHAKEQLEGNDPNNPGVYVIPEGVETLFQSCFMYCWSENSSVTKIVCPESLRTVNQFAFRSVKGLREIEFKEGLEEILDGFNFLDSNSLVKITLPSTVTTISDSVFVSMPNLRYVYTTSNTGKFVSALDGSCLYVKTDSGNEMLWVSQALTGTFTVPSNITRLGQRAFSRCVGLTEIIIPEGVVEIGAYCFEECQGLTDLYLPDSIVLIDKYVIRDTNSIEQLTFRVHGKRNSYAKLFADKYNLEFVATDAVSQEDNDTGLVAEVPNGSFEGEVPAFYVRANDAAHNKDKLNNGNILLNYTLDFKDGNESVQPEKGIEIRVPVEDFLAAGGKSNNPKIYYVGDHGNVVNMKGKLDGYYYVFWTPHFSDYSLMDDAVVFSDRPNIIVGNANAKSGGVFSVPVTISNNTGIGSLEFDISFDNDIMSFVNAQDGGLFTAYGCEKIRNNTYRFTFSSSENVTAEGTLVILNFSMKANVFDSTNFISVTVNDCKTHEGDDVTTYAECGEVDVVYFGRIDGKQLVLGEEISFDFFAVLSPEQEGAQMRFTINGKTTVVNGTPTGVVNEYKFRFNGINPQCLGDDITAELILGDYVLDELGDVSVLSYCKKLVSMTKEQLMMSQDRYDAMVRLIADLMEYGTQSQIFTNHKADELVGNDAVISELTKTTFAPIAERHMIYTPSTSEDIYVMSATVNCSSVNKLCFRFKADGAGDNFRVVISDFRGGDPVEYRLDECIEDNGSYLIYSEAISALFLTSNNDDYRTITITLKNGDETIQSVGYNVISYVYDNQNKQNINGDIAKALYNYGLSARAYKNAN